MCVMLFGDENFGVSAFVNLMNCIVLVSIFFDDAKRGKSKYSGT